jgi:hypothetical protein
MFGMCIFEDRRKKQAARCRLFQWRDGDYISGYLDLLTIIAEALLHLEARSLLGC